jgi:hypothetical protein
MENSAQRIKMELSVLIKEGVEILLYETEEKGKEVIKTLF